MAKFFKYSGLVAILMFSFYYTEKTALFVKSKTPLMQEINKQSNKLNTKSVNAIIDNNYIIPGINGLEVDVSKSYVSMKKLGSYNEYYMVFNEITPKISLENNKDKIINQGNNLKNGISLIIEDNKEIVNYFINKKIKTNILINYNEFNKNSFLEQINNDIDNFNKLDKLFIKHSLSNKLCLVNNNNIDLCKDSNYYLIEPTYILNNNNLANIKSKIKSGVIILIKNDVSIDNINLLLEQIKYRDLTIMPLSKLISEHNSK